MLEKLRQKIFEFIYSDKDFPVLAGISIGFYMLLFYYSKNFALSNSFVQILFFTGYYVIIPVAILFIGYKVFLYKAPAYKRNFLFIAMIALFSYYIIQLNSFPVSKRILFVVIIAISVFIARWLKTYYKFLILLLFFMSVFNIKPLIKIGLAALKTNDKWLEQPDGIEQAVFKKKPNIYYIQPDGYVNFNSLKDTVYNYDNSEFESFLKSGGFTLYENFHSNYFSTLLSNSSMLSMKHHYIQADVSDYAARDVIVGNNAVLRTLKHNGYNTHFITEKPYLLVNRPKMGFDYCNIPYSEIPFIKDGWAFNYEVLPVIKELTKKNTKSGNFYFIEKFKPGHIHGFESHSSGVEKEKDAYIDALKEANIWLKETISYINEADPEAIIVIGADHGGFAGFKYTLQSLEKTENPDLVWSVFGSAMAVKWNDKNNESRDFDGELKSAVNLFRVLFAYLAEDKKYLDHVQDNSSYIYLSKPKGLYRYIDNQGNVVFDEAANVQN